MMQTTTDDESGALLSYLNAQREHVMGILEGLSEEALRRPVLPSGWNWRVWYGTSPSTSSASGSAPSSPANRSISMPPRRSQRPGTSPR